MRLGNRGWTSSNGPIRGSVVGVAFDNGVRVADIDRDEADAVDLFRLGDGDLAQVLLDEAVLAELAP